MINYTKANLIDLEGFWLKELERASDLSPRLCILLQFRRTFPKRWFTSLIKDSRFLDWLDACENYIEKKRVGGRPPDEDTVLAFMGLRAGRPCEDVFEEVLQEAVLRSRAGRTDHETKLAKEKNLEPIKKKIYRVCRSLEADGFPIKHRSRTSVEFRKLLSKFSA